MGSGRLFEGSMSLGQGPYLAYDCTLAIAILGKTRNSRDDNVVESVCKEWILTDTPRRNRPRSV
jgi:hypothetical protein